MNMELKNQNILFFTRTMQQGGTENVVVQLCEIFKPVVNKIVVCSCGGVNVRKLTEMKIRHYSIPDITEKEPWKVFMVAKSLRYIVKEEEITVIHTHHRMAAFYVFVLRLYRKCGFINTSHNTFYDKRMLTKTAYKHSNLIACGEMVKKNLIEEFKLADSRITVIRNAVKPLESIVHINAEIRKLHEEGLFVIGNIGRLSKQKGMKYFIEAAPSVIEKHPDARFLIIGSGEEEEELKKLVFDRRLEKYVLFLGYREEIQKLMSQMDLIVLSSLWEGLPLTPIEAYSVGKTVVATAVDGTMEIVCDGVNGCLAEPGNAEALANKINYLIEHPDIRAEFERNAEKRYREDFSYAKFAASYIGYYERL